MLPTMIACRTLFNETRLVPREKLILRPAAYGIIVHGGRILLLKAPHTRLLTLPGGGIDTGELNEDALAREVQEETGVTITVGEFLHFHTDFFYYDPLDLALHGFLFYYACAPLTFDLISDDRAELEEGVPRWIDLQTLRAESFQTHGMITMQLIRQVSSQADPG